MLHAHVPSEWGANFQWQASFLPLQLLVCCSCRCRLFTSISFTRMPPMLQAQHHLWDRVRM